MKTDFETHPPHADYKATLKVTATKEEFQKLYKLIEASELGDIQYSRIYDNVLTELQDLIQYMSVGEEYGGL